MHPLGAITLDLPPGPGNPRNSEGAFYTREDGSILFVYSKFVGETNDDDALASIACRESRDGGLSWTQQDRILFTAGDHHVKNVMSVSLLPMQNGDIGLFYAVRYGWHDTRLIIRRSRDRGETWGEALPCIPCPGYFVTNNDRVIRLKSGRILVPANLHRMRGFDQADWSSFDGRGMPVMFASDDDGLTWHEAGSAFVSLPHSRSGLQESGVLELNGGALWQWMRTDLGRQYESFSLDEGESFTAPAPSHFTGPCSPLSVKRIPKDGRLLAVYNPIPNYNGRALSKAGWGRTPLVISMSADDGKNWSEPVIVEDGPEHGYCYTAIHFAADAVLLAYCAGGPEDQSCLSRAVIRRIPLRRLP